MRAHIRTLMRASGSIVLALLLVPGVAAHADTREELEQAKDRLEALNDTLTARESVLDELQAQLNELAARIGQAESEAALTRQEIAFTRTEIEANQRQFAVLQEQLNERAVEAFISGPASNLDFLLGAQSMADLSDRVEFLDAVQEQDTDLGYAVHDQVAQLQMARSDLGQMLARQKERLDALGRFQTELNSKFAEQRTLFDETQSLRDEAAALVSKLSQKLQQELMPPPPTSSGGDGVPGPLFACPVDGPRAYGDTFGQVHAHEGWTHYHQGNDIIAPYGIPIVAPFAGTAVSGSDDNAGLYVTVTGAGGFVQMMHMSSFGALGTVDTGDVVGYIGTTGNASGPHTHFEWHPGGGSAVDPYPLLSEVC